MASGGNGPSGAGSSGQDETFWNKFGTLGRKKKVEEVKEVATEGKHAIDSPGMPKSPEMPPEVHFIQTTYQKTYMFTKGKTSKNCFIKDQHNQSICVFTGIPIGGE